MADLQDPQVSLPTTNQLPVSAPGEERDIPHPVTLKEASLSAGAKVEQGGAFDEIEARERAEREGNQTGLEKLTSGFGGMLLHAPLAALEKVSPSLAHQVEGVAGSIVHSVGDLAGQAKEAAISAAPSSASTDASTMRPGGEFTSATGDAAYEKTADVGSRVASTLSGVAHSVGETAKAYAPSSIGGNAPSISAQADALVARSQDARREAEMAIQSAAGTSTTPPTLGQSALEPATTTGIVDTAKHALDYAKSFIPSALTGAGVTTSVPPFTVISSQHEAAEEAGLAGIEPAGARKQVQPTETFIASQPTTTTTTTTQLPAAPDLAHRAAEEIRHLGDVAASYLPSAPQQQQAAERTVNQVQSTASTVADRTAPVVAQATQQVQAAASVVADRAAPVASQVVEQAQHGAQVVGQQATQVAAAVQSHLPTVLGGPQIAQPEEILRNLDTPTSTTDRGISSDSISNEPILNPAPVSVGAAPVPTNVQLARETATDVATGLQQSANDGLENVKAAATSAYDSAAKTASNAYNSAATTTSNVYDSAATTASQAYDSSASTLQSGKEQAASSLQYGQEKAADTLDSTKRSAADSYDAAKSSVASGAETVRQSAPSPPDLSKLRGDSAASFSSPGTATITQQHSVVPDFATAHTGGFADAAVPKLLDDKDDEPLAITAQPDASTKYAEEKGSHDLSSQAHDEAAATAPVATHNAYAVPPSHVDSSPIHQNTGYENLAATSSRSDAVPHSQLDVNAHTANFFPVQQQQQQQQHFSTQPQQFEQYQQQPQQGQYDLAPPITQHATYADQSAQVPSSGFASNNPFSDSHSVGTAPPTHSAPVLDSYQPSSSTSKETTGAGEPRTYSATATHSSEPSATAAHDEQHKAGLKDKVKGVLHLGKVVEK